MNKKVILSLASMVSISSIVVAHLFAKHSSNFSTIFAESGTWYHYPAVEPTESCHGSLEFWANDNDGCVTHTFTNPGVTCVEHDFSEYPSFASMTVDDDRYVPSLFEQRNAVYPKNNGDGTITYGIYPQTNVDKKSLLDSLNALDDSSIQENGWYLFEGAFYTKVIAAPYGSDYVFNNGKTIVANETYWFKCEAISWKILDSSSDTYFVLSTMLLDAHCCYHENANRTIDDKTIYPNNYEYSDLREWLNGEFYQGAFNLNNSNIQKTEIDNSALTTDSETNPYVCNNTEDYVYLPSYKDYLNPNYGFSSSTTAHNSRLSYTTDYGRARGGVYTANSSNKFSGHYFTRSPRSTLTYDMWGVGWTANIVGSNITYSRYGVRPSMTLKIN